MRVIMNKISSIEISEYLSSEWPFLETTHYGSEGYILGVDEISSAGSNELTYATEYTDDNEIRNTQAGVLICESSQADQYDGTAIICDSPKEAFVLFYEKYFREIPTKTKIHPTAFVSDDAKIGSKTVIEPFVYVGPNVRIGDNCWIQPNTVIGTEGFGFTRDNDGKLHRQAHTAGIEIGDNVELGANNAVDHGVFTTTKIGDGTKTDNFVHIPHNAKVGEDVMLTVGCMLSGHSTIEDHAYLHPQVTVGNWVTVGEGSEVGSHSTVLDDIPPYSKAVGTPAEVIGDSRYK